MFWAVLPEALSIWFVCVSSTVSGASFGPNAVQHPFVLGGQEDSLRYGGSILALGTDSNRGLDLVTCDGYLQ